MKAVKAFTKPFEAPQKSVKIKILVNFFSSSGIGDRLKSVLLVFNYYYLLWFYYLKLH